MPDCAICLRDTQKMTQLVCSHSFCEDCITCWLAISNKCPVCTQVVSENSPVYSAEVEEMPPCVDFSPQLHYVQQRLQDARRRVNLKWNSSQSLKSNVSKQDAQYLLDQYKQADELFSVFQIMVSEGNNPNEIVPLMETINFKLLDIEEQLQSGVNYQGSRAYREDDYEEEFPEVQEKASRFQRKAGKAQKPKNNKVK